MSASTARTTGALATSAERSPLLLDVALLGSGVAELFLDLAGQAVVLVDGGLHRTVGGEHGDDAAARQGAQVVDDFQAQRVFERNGEAGRIGGEGEDVHLAGDVFGDETEGCGLDVLFAQVNDRHLERLAHRLRQRRRRHPAALDQQSVDLLAVALGQCLGLVGLLTRDCTLLHQNVGDPLALCDHGSSPFVLQL